MLCQLLQVCSWLCAQGISYFCLTCHDHLPPSYTSTFPSSFALSPPNIIYADTTVLDSWVGKYPGTVS